MPLSYIFNLAYHYARAGLALSKQSSGSIVVQMHIHVHVYTVSVMLEWLDC